MEMAPRQPEATTRQIETVATASMLLLLSLQATMLAWGAAVHFPVTDEPVHLAAGVQHLRRGQFYHNRGNPPLVDMIAAVPTVLGEAGARRSESSGARVIASSVLNRRATGAHKCIVRGRWMLIPFSLLGGYVCFVWARELYGALAGLLALTIWCADPNILSHGMVVTGDIAATALGAAASYCFWRWLQAPAWGRAFVAGCVLGVAQLSKYVCIVFFAIWPLLWLIWRVPQWRRGEYQGMWREGAQAGIMLLVSLYIINAGYGFERSCRSFGELRCSSPLLNHWSCGAVAEANEGDGLGASVDWVPIPLPANYLLGISDISTLFAEPRLSYLRGQWREGGWWYFYLYGFLVKLPLGTWLVFGAAMIGRLVRNGAWAHWRHEAAILVPLAAMLAFVSCVTTLHLHLRYALPILPFAFIWASGVAQTFTLKRGLLCAAAGAGVAWSVFSSLWVFPHSTAYFNELAGGPTEGHAHLIYSNIDWGQDLLFLKEWYHEHPGARPFHLAYFGYYDPVVAGIDYSLPGSLTPATDRDGQLHPATGPEPGWHAVSVTLLRGHPWSVPDGDGSLRSTDHSSYSYFLNCRPIAMAGYSIYIYHLTNEETHGLRRQLGFAAPQESR